MVVDDNTINLQAAYEKPFIAEIPLSKVREAISLKMERRNYEAH